MNVRSPLIFRFSCIHPGPAFRMAMSYSAALSSSTPPSNPNDGSNGMHRNTKQDKAAPRKPQPPEKSEYQRTERTSQRPETTSEDEDVYILTIATTRDHHQRMTELRKKYFPRKIYKVGAHLTLFHALPESRLESSIIPVIQDICSRTSQFHIIADGPQKLGKHGIGVFLNISSSREIQHVRSQLLQSFREGGWLSQQDSGNIKPHYTIMNKVQDDSEVNAAFHELRETFEPDHGTAEGLGLWRYDRGWWRWVRNYPFTANNPSQGDRLDQGNMNVHWVHPEPWSQLDLVWISQEATSLKSDFGSRMDPFPRGRKIRSESRSHGAIIKGAQ